MRRLLLFAGCLLLAFAAPLGAIHAQGGLDADAQAMLDAARGALDDFYTLETFTTEHRQSIDQQIGVRLDGQSITVDQQIEQQGVTLTERAGGRRFDNLSSTLEQEISQTISGAGLNQAITTAQALDMIALDDRVYLRIASDDPDLAGFFPDGWVEVTDGADSFPGLDVYDMDQLLSLGSSAFTAEIIGALLDAAVAVERLAPETLDGVTVERVHLMIDSAAAFTGEGADALKGMFNTQALPLDVGGMLDLIFADPNTRYEITLLLGADDGVLYGYDVLVSLDVAIPGNLLTDPTLSGAEISLTQTSVSVLRFTERNAPMSITAPELEE